jgi:hypothetical protein
LARYFFFSVLVAVGLYLAMRFSIGAVVLTGVQRAAAEDVSYMVPGIFAGVVTSWLLRPMIRARTLVGPCVAAGLFPFVAGVVFGAALTIFGRTAEASTDFVVNISKTFHAGLDAPSWVLRTLPVSIPAAFIAVFVLRRSDPTEALTDKKGPPQAAPYA